MSLSRYKKVAGYFIPVWIELLDDAHVDGRVIITNDKGNVMCNMTEWLFDQCWKLRYFGDAP